VSALAARIRRGERYTVTKTADGGWPAKHHSGLNPALVGPRAFEHPSVRGWWRWLLEEYRPRSPVALVTPCSSVKPYTRSPTSRKIRGLLRRLGLWDYGSDRPRGVEWLYLSDLLLLVPYERAGEYPACCYEVPPEVVLCSPALRSLVTSLLAEAVERLYERGLRRVIIYLPKKHLGLWNEAKKRAVKWPSETVTKYSIFRFDGLPQALSSLQGMPHRSSCSQG